MEVMLYSTRLKNVNRGVLYSTGIKSYFINPLSIQYFQITRQALSNNFTMVKKMSIKERIEQTLRQKLSAADVQVLDESDAHAGHREAMTAGGGHYSVVVVSDAFDGKKSMERHRMVYQLLEKELKGEIHALGIKALTTREIS